MLHTAIVVTNQLTEPNVSNTGYTIKIEDSGYFVEFFSMNSQTFDVSVIERWGPYQSRDAAELAESSMRRSVAEEEGKGWSSLIRD